MQIVRRAAICNVYQSICIMKFLKTGFNSPKFFKKNNNKGFSLVEILVSLAVFSIVAIAIGGFFLMSVRGQRNTIARQNLIDNVRFAIEFMSRQIRLAQQDIAGSCTGSADSMFTESASDISFISYDGDCITYQLAGEKIQIRPDDGESFSDMTSDDIIINSLEFTVDGRESDDGEQPRVTVIIEAETSGQRPEDNLSIEVQTTISARNIDVP
ncbi:MAG: hypothetical protein A2827_03360 [Candidatus Spechtbacteria bacterium RIFCSPHIGHO2_01_FULL_43_30]|uniref:Prepilin-type N-terminal cleavage/methylation domain-containing protein n=1 Tax=Candidatus Spechtbacteria bacterium RIFCSPHIGHO2_01_FULL_43_30 TaxID=1802158 RepID=A0A1G2H858_9BACT|nr:MAG: hypothetical protein A2827_03360 [Candidatus Spechtbacteria bacterium RIFCSPHIGHO2_01_FULL_43_30]